MSSGHQNYLRTANDTTGQDQAEAEQSLKVWNCINCRRRKVRCDRRLPCGPCTKNKAECVFPTSGRLPRRSQNDATKTQKRAQLVGRLRRLEALVGGLGEQVENAGMKGEMDLVGEDHDDLLNQAANGNSSMMQNDLQDAQSKDASLKNLSQHFDNDAGVVVEADDGDLIVKDRFWTVFCKEVEEIFVAVHGPTEMHFDETSSPSNTSTSGNQHHDGYYNFLLRHTSAGDQQEQLHPLPSQMLFLWQIYLENVDPFLKVLHVPIVTKVIHTSRGSYQSLGLGMRALVLAIALAAIMSLDDDQAQANFQMSRMQLLMRYRKGTEKALEQADVINKSDLTAVQAFTIYLGVLQHIGEAKSAWCLLGTLIRIAVSMNLHRDGSRYSHLAPFEVEMRRRLWWHIAFLDSRSVQSQVSAFKISEHMFDTQQPANMDDADLDAEMTTVPVSSTIDVGSRWTDTTITCTQCEIWKLSKRLQSLACDSFRPSDIEPLRNHFLQASSRIQRNYLSHLDPAIPLRSFIAATTQLFFTKVSLTLKCPKAHLTNDPFDSPVNSARSGLSSTSRLPSVEAFDSAIALLHQTTFLQTHQAFTPYRWTLFHGRSTSGPEGAHQPSFEPPWHALRIVLTHLLRVLTLSKRPHKSTNGGMNSSTNNYDNNAEGGAPRELRPWTTEYAHILSTARSSLSASSFRNDSRSSPVIPDASNTADPRYRYLNNLLEKIDECLRYPGRHHRVRSNTNGPAAAEARERKRSANPSITTTAETATDTEVINQKIARPGTTGVNQQHAIENIFPTFNSTILDDDYDATTTAIANKTMSTTVDDEHALFPHDNDVTFTFPALGAPNPDPDFDLDLTTITDWSFWVNDNEVVEDGAEKEVDGDPDTNTTSWDWGWSGEMI